MTEKKTQTKTQTKTAGPPAPKPVKLKNKTEVRNASAKLDKLIRGIDNNDASIRKHQAEIEKKIEENTKSTAVARALIAGISNHALQQPAPQPAAKPAAKPAAQKAKPAASSKPAAKPAAKPAKPAAKPAKPAAKAAAKKPAKPAAKKPAKPAGKKPASTAGWGRKSDYKLDEVARDIIVEFKAKNGGKLPTAAQIFHGTEAFAKKHNFKWVDPDTGDFWTDAKTGEPKDDSWSRQSLYNQLKITERFTRVGDGQTATFDNASQKSASKATDADAETYVKSVESKSQAVANVS